MADTCEAASKFPCFECGLASGKRELCGACGAVYVHGGSCMRAHHAHAPEDILDCAKLAKFAARETFYCDDPFERGLVAKRNLRAGETILVEQAIAPTGHGEIGTSSEQATLALQASIDAHYRLARYLNSSCRPNASRFFVGENVCVVALRSISAGSQILINYDLGSVACRCGFCSVDDTDDSEGGRMPYGYSVEQDRAMFERELRVRRNFSPVFHSAQIGCGCAGLFAYPTEVDGLARVGAIVASVGNLLATVMHAADASALDAAAKASAMLSFEVIELAATHKSDFIPVVYHVMKYSTPDESLNRKIACVIRFIHACEPLFEFYQLQAPTKKAAKQDEFARAIKPFYAAYAGAFVAKQEPIPDDLFNVRPNLVSASIRAYVSAMEAQLQE